jgi:hypothetical protein
MQIKLGTPLSYRYAGKGMYESGCMDKGMHLYVSTLILTVIFRNVHFLEIPP